jgi:YesN/AraC family two-component response regulator
LVDWQKYKDRLKDEPLTEEQEAAFAVAARVTKPEKAIEKRKNKAGDKRRARHNSLKRVTLPGCTEERSNLLRDIVSLHFSGSTLREAFTKVAKMYEIIPNTAEKYYYKHKEAIIRAEEDHLRAISKEYQHNLLEVKTMMSEAGPRALETIVEVMDSVSTSPATRLKAAQAVLKMMNVDGSATANPKPAAKNESLVLVGQVINQKGDQESHVIEAEDVEVLEGENASEARVDRCM